MPNIPNYGSTEVGGQSATISSGANLRYSSSIAPALSSIGNSIEDAGTRIYMRQAQSEQSDLNSQIADQRAEWTTRLDEEFRKGTLDTEKFIQGFDQQIGKLSDGLETSEGRNFYESQTARLRASLIKGATRRQADLAGTKATADWKNALNKNSSSLITDPSTFQDIYESTLDSIDSQVSAGALPADISDKLKLDSGKELAVSAVKGWAQLNPTLAAKKLNDGQFDQFFDGETKASLQGYINQQGEAKEREERRVIVAQEKAQKAASEAWQQSALPQLAKGALPMKSILNSPMSPDEKIRWMKLADEALKDATQTDPRVKNRLTADILEGKITNISQIAPYAGRGISINDVTELNNFMNKLPEGQAQADGEKRLFDLAKKTLGARDPMSGMLMTDGDSEYNISRFMAAYQKRKQELIKEGKSTSGLLDPDSKDYFGFRVKEYKLTPQQIIDKRAQVVSAQTAAQAQQQAGQRRIRVVSPQGQSGTILESEKAAYLSRGFRLQE